MGISVSKMLIDLYRDTTSYESTALRLITLEVRYLLHRAEVNGVIAAPLSDGHGITDRPEYTVALHARRRVAGN